MYRPNPFNMVVPWLLVAFFLSKVGLHWILAGIVSAGIFILKWAVLNAVYGRVVTGWAEAENVRVRGFQEAPWWTDPMPTLPLLRTRPTTLHVLVETPEGEILRARLVLKLLTVVRAEWLTPRSPIATNRRSNR